MKTKLMTLLLGMFFFSNLAIGILALVIVVGWCHNATASFNITTPLLCLWVMGTISHSIMCSLNRRVAELENKLVQTMPQDTRRQEMD
jgi:hypothetical protein